MAALTLFPLQFKRQDSVAIDIDQIFATTAERTAYLTSPRRYAGMVVTDLELEQVFFLNTARDAWIPIEGTGPTGPAGPAGPTGPAGTFPTLAINNYTNSITLGLVDINAMARMNVAGPNTVTIPPDADVAFAIGDTSIISQVGDGVTSLLAGSGVTINTPLTLTLGMKFGKVTITKVAANEWDVEGNLAAP
jgi:hypothetical protein